MAKFSERWLREWVNPPVDTVTLCQQLTQLGLEVDACLPVAKRSAHGSVPWFRSACGVPSRRFS